MALVLRNPLVLTEKALTGEWNHVGIASDPRREKWVILFASTWDVATDRCDNGTCPSFHSPSPLTSAIHLVHTHAPLQLN
jgi:hypothetical protein